MSIVSWYFPFFIAFFFCVYFLTPEKMRWCVLLLTNVLFYAWAGVKGFVIALCTALFTYLVALRMDKNREKEQAEKNKTLFLAATIIMIAAWLILKFGSRAEGSILIVPLGISFYSLNNIAYLSDVSRKKYPAEKNFLYYLTYILYFPSIIQGPFTRYPKMKEQLLVGHSFSYERLSRGTLRALYGLCIKKLIIANQLAVIVNEVFKNYSSASGLKIFLALVLYSIELYADFSGYMDIVNGISHVIGIEMPENFERPYFSMSLDEFWRRWHISLGAWFREYLFFPISMNKTVQKLGKAARKRFGNKTGKLLAGDVALFFVWTATGLWHDFSWTYLIWGYLNMLVIIGSLHLDDSFKKMKEKLRINDNNRFYKFFRMIRTFVLVCLIRIPSVSSSLTMMHGMYGRLFTKGNASDLFTNVGGVTLFILVVSILSMFLIDILSEKKKWQDMKERCPLIVKDIVVALLIICFILFVGGDNDLLGGFMYARF